MSFEFSGCRKYRYLSIISLENNVKNKSILFVGLNPSNSVEKVNPTIQRCITFADKWGYNTVLIANLFSLVAASPKDLLTSNIEPIGSENNQWLIKAYSMSQVTVFCWGAYGNYIQRDEWAYRFMNPSYCLGRTKSGQPRHPLYLPSQTTLVPFILDGQSQK